MQTATSRRPMARFRAKRRSQTGKKVARRSWCMLLFFRLIAYLPPKAHHLDIARRIQPCAFRQICEVEVESRQEPGQPLGSRQAPGIRCKSRIWARTVECEPGQVSCFALEWLEIQVQRRQRRKGAGEDFELCVCWGILRWQEKRSWRPNARRWQGVRRRVV